MITRKRGKRLQGNFPIVSLSQADSTRKDENRESRVLMMKHGEFFFFLFPSFLFGFSFDGGEGKQNRKIGNYEKYRVTEKMKRKTIFVSFQSELTSLWRMSLCISSSNKKVLLTFMIESRSWAARH